MTSDERVQIFVPSPQGTPYNTITKGQNSANSTAAIGSANLAPLFVPNRIPNSESYRSLTPLNMYVLITCFHEFYFLLGFFCEKKSVVLIKEKKRLYWHFIIYFDS